MDFSQTRTIPSVAACAVGIPTRSAAHSSVMLQSRAMIRFIFLNSSSYTPTPEFGFCLFETLAKVKNDGSALPARLMEKVPDWARNTADFCIEKYSITGRRASNLGPAYKQIVYILFAGKHNHSQFAEKTKLLPENRQELHLS